MKARPLLKDKSYGELIDPVVLESHDLHQLFWMVRIAEKCINRDPGKRFSIHKVHHFSKKSKRTTNLERTDYGESEKPDNQSGILM